MTGNHNCRVCGRLFKSANALNQHKGSVGHGAEKHKPAKKSYNKGAPAKTSAGQMSGAQRSVMGTDLLGTLDVTAADPVGTMLAAFRISPTAFFGTRLSQEAKLWTRWRPVKFAFRLVTSAGTYVSGSYIVGWSMRSEQVPLGDQAVRKLSTMIPNRQVQIGKNTSLTIPCTGANAPSSRWYYVDSTEEEDSSHGVVYVVLAGRLSSLASGSSVQLSLHLDWSVAFANPDIDSISPGKEIHAAVGWEGYHTTSLSSWHDGKYLSLKATAGGELVNFPQADPGVVYKLDTKAKLYMVQSRKQVEVGYAVRIHDSDYDYPTLTVFEKSSNGLAYALKYAERNDVAYLYKYEAAGAAVKPENPAWIQYSASSAKLTNMLDFQAPRDVYQTTIEEIPLSGASSYEQM